MNSALGGLFGMVSLLVSLLMTGVVSASTSTSAGTETCVAFERSLTLEMRQGCEPTYDDSAPGSLLPVWGPGKAAFKDFRAGRWGWGTFNTACAVIDVTGLGWVANKGAKYGGRILRRVFRGARKVDEAMDAARAARGASGVSEALKGLRTGPGSGVKVVDSAGELEGLFGRLSSGGRTVEGSSYPGGLVVRQWSRPGSGPSAQGASPWR